MGIFDVRRTSALVLACALASCAHGGAGLPLPNANVPAASGEDSSRTTASGHRIGAKIVIHIPKRKRVWRVRVRGHYISASTKSIVIAVTPSKGGQTESFNADLTPATNHNCSGSPVACTLTLSLKPGKYVASFATYSGLLDAHGSPTGDELSANQNVAMHVAAGTNNAMHVAMEGIAARFAIEPAADSTIAGDTATGFTVAKCGPTPKLSKSANVSVIGVDAANNYIVGPGAPVPQLASQNPAILTVTKSASGFTLTHPISSVSLGPVTLTASAAQPDVTRAAAKPATTVTTLSIEGGPQICGVATSFQAAQAIGDVIAGPDGAMWFASSCDGRLGECQNSIGRITTDGAVTIHQLPVDGVIGTFVYGITAGPDGAIWFTQLQDEGNSIGRMTTDGTITQTSALSKSNFPYGITAGPDGALWFTDPVTNSVGRMTTDFTLTETPLPTSSAHPDRIVAGPDGALWFTENTANKIGRITTGGAITETTLPTASSGPLDITVGSDGALWFTETTNPKIGRITTDGTLSEVSIPAVAAGADSDYIASGPDGAMWFTGDGFIGRIDADGTVTETPAAYPYGAGIATGPDGALWFGMTWQFVAPYGYIGRLQ